MKGQEGNEEWNHGDNWLWARVQKWPHVARYDSVIVWKGLLCLLQRPRFLQNCNFSGYLEPVIWGWDGHCHWILMAFAHTVDIYLHREPCLSLRLRWKWSSGFSPETVFNSWECINFTVWWGSLGRKGAQTLRIPAWETHGENPLLPTNLGRAVLWLFNYPT